MFAIVILTPVGGKYKRPSFVTDEDTDDAALFNTEEEAQAAALEVPMCIAHEFFILDLENMECL